MLILLTILGVGWALSTPVEICLNSMQPALLDCGDDTNCRCSVLADEGSRCLSSAPAGSLVELIASVDDGTCLKVNYLEIATVFNEIQGSTLGASALCDPEESKNMTVDDLLAKLLQEEDSRDEELATRFASWMDHKLSTIYNVATKNDDTKNSTNIDTSPLQPAKAPRLFSLIYRFVMYLTQLRV